MPQTDRFKKTIKHHTPELLVVATALVGIAAYRHASRTRPVIAKLMITQDSFDHLLQNPGKCAIYLTKFGEIEVFATPSS